MDRFPQHPPEDDSEGEGDSSGGDEADDEAEDETDDKAALPVPLFGGSNDWRVQRQHASLLINAINQGNVARVARLLKAGVNPNHSLDVTPVFSAYRARHHDIVRLLLQAGARPDDTNQQDGTNILSVACENDDVSILPLLFEHGSDPNHPVMGSRPLVIAADKGNFNTVLFLLDHGANINITDNTNLTALHAACYHGHVDVVDLLLSRHANPNVISENGTALTTACQKEHIDVIDRLLAIDVDLNLPDRDGLTALMFACKKSNFDIIDRLLVHGANVNLADPRGWTALMYASQEGSSDITRRYSALMQWDLHDPNAPDVPIKKNIDVIERLLTLGANVNAFDSNGTTALMIACKNKLFDVAEYLVRSGAFVNVRSGSSTPLLLSFQRGDWKTVDLLLSNDADFEPHIKDRNLLIACEGSSVDMARVLLQHGANPNVTGHHGVTPLMTAARNEKHALVSLLLDHGADRNLCDASGRKAVHLSRDPLIVSLLSEPDQHPSAS